MRLIALLATLILAPTIASAQLKIDITKGNVDPLPVAITGFTGDTANGASIAAVVSANLERSGLFRPISSSAFIEQVSNGDQVPRFADWRQINAQAIVTGTVTPIGTDRLKVSFRLWDALAEQQVAGKEYNTFTRNWRRIAHLISDEIYKRLTGENGYFDSRIVYVSETGPANRKIKRLAIMDQDGENHKYLTDGRSLVLTPRFSPNTQEILYMSYAGRQPRVFLRDLQTGREEMLGRFDGMSFAPRFNHDGSRMLMSIAKGGTTNVFEMDLRSRQMRQLTNGRGTIDTSPSYSPDGSKIVFNSDRGGSQQLYTMDSNGGNVQRISFGTGNYGTPVWSPRGDLIAFTKISGGQFYIGVMRSDGSGERLLTQSWLDEGPSWAPNGRVLVFSREFPGRGGTRARLYSVDITGHNLREVITPTDASDPAWSPLLPM
ncbi:MAG: Tol-Pal system protein TolB [Alphaproteobacteria bacterium]|nr:Tol-Pal system protein TolB [Alphaproteobacteria bacterium]